MATVTKNERVAARPPSHSEDADPSGFCYRPSRSVFPQSFFSRNLFAPVPLQSSMMPVLVPAGLRAVATAPADCFCFVFLAISICSFIKGASAAVTQHFIQSRALIRSRDANKACRPAYKPLTVPKPNSVRAPSRAARVPPPRLLCNAFAGTAV